MSRPTVTRAHIPWVECWESANRAFYRDHKAEHHFATPVSVSTHTARKVATLLAEEDFDHSIRTVVDVGSGSGTLLGQLASLVDSDIRLIGVDTRPRPDGLDSSIEWRRVHIDAGVEEITGDDGKLNGIVMAHEFLDDVPCPVVELDDHLNARIVLVDPATGSEEIGPALSDAAAGALLGDMTNADATSWLNRWWPATKPFARREIGLARDRVWRRLTRVLNTGYAVGVDYAHRFADRRTGLWDGGTLRGFAAGYPQPARPDGTVNITAHVALDSCAAAGAWMLPQHEVFASWSLDSWPLELGSFEWLIEPVRSDVGSDQ